MQSLECPSYAFLCLSIFSFTPRYAEKVDSIEREKTTVNIQFVTLSSSLIKSSLMQHWSEWHTKLTQLLSHMATTRIKELDDSLQDNAYRWGVK